ncbi:MAG: efflux RND transporter permease subunit, partial [Proteobacteria bacterium]|nr:efflux RND transporter permease subunit [Pseudomonadota bacterium]
MSVVQLLVSQKRLILTTAVLLALFGLHSWFNMNRQEDPFFPYRHGFVLTQYPGADVNRIELQVLKPIEEELAQIEEIDELTSVVRAGFAQIIIEMHEHIYDTDRVWDKVRRAVSKAQLKFPEGVMAATVEDRLMDTAAVVYSVSGQTNILELRKIAKKIKNRLFNLNNVGKVALYGMPEEQISITLDEGEIKKLNISHEFIAEQVSARTSVVAINPVHAGSKRINLDAHSELDSIDEIKSTIITLADGSNLPLSAIAKVKYEPKSAASSGFWHDGKRSIALAIYIPNDILNVVDFGKSLRNYMQE